MTAADRPGPGDLALLDELLASQELWIERAEEGRALADRVLASKAAIVVLHGPARGGKTELVQRWVMPALSQNPQGWRALYRTRADMAGAAEDPDGPVIEVWDEFERWLAAEEPLRTSLLARLARSSESGGRLGRMVLILQEDHLSSLFQLCNAVPRLLDDVGEIPAMSQARLSRALADTVGPRGVRVSASFLDSLVHDLDAARSVAGLGPELVAVLSFELCRSRVDRELTGDDYHALAGLSGILETHLDFVFERLPESIEPQIGWAVVQEVVATRPGRPVDLTDISHRFDVALDVPTRVLRWLTEERHILRADAEGGFSVVPGQFAGAAEARARRDADAAEQPRRMLRQGIQHFADGEATLPEQSFRKVHAHRSALRVTPEEAALMLRCALAYENDLLPGATSHWLRRVKEPDAQVEILLDALFDSRVDVRQRAARHLSAFPRPEVRNQLHLLALRDPAVSVRAQAVDSLDAIKDADLRVSLIREVQDRTSPYRLQAIDALRIFTDADTVGVLVGIIKDNAPADDQEARTRAIAVLGCHNTEPAADALLAIALLDEDAEDREGSARALGRTGADKAARRALSRLKDPTQLTRKPRRPFFSVASIMALVQITLAGLVVLLNVMIHGLILATIGRVKLAVALTVAEGLIVVAMNSGQPWVALLLPITFSVGVLMPTRTLLNERLAGVSQSSYRRKLGGVLFAFDAATFFLAFHGLASMLIRQVRGGLVLIGFEALGVFLLVSFTYFFEDTFVGFEQASGTIRLIPQVLTYLGWSLFFISYVVDVGSVLLEVFLWRDKRQVDRRLDDVYAQLLRNQVASGVVLDACRSSDRTEAKWGGRVAQRYRKVVLENLRHLWSEADAITRGRILRIMARRPDAETVEFLRTAAPALGWRGRLRYIAALWSFRFSVWPKPLLFLMAVAVFALVSYTSVLYVYTRSTPEFLLRTAQDPRKELEPRLEAVEGLTKLAESPDRRVSRMAALSLRFALTDSASETDNTTAVRQNVLSAILKVDSLPDREGMVFELLTNLGVRQETRKRAVVALQQLGTHQAATKLKEFVERPSALPSRAFRGGQPGADETDLELRKEAIAALGNFGGAGVEPLHLLQDLADDSSLSNDLRLAANGLVKAPDRILRCEDLVNKGQYDDAIRQAEALIRELADTASAQRVRLVVAKAYARRGSLALSAQRYPSAEADLRSGLRVLTDPQLDPSNVTDLFTLGLNLVFQYHEALALNSPKAFEDSYQTLSGLKAVTDKFPKSSAGFNSADFHANLAEASLTTGRYDEAIRFAEQAAEHVKPPTKDASALNTSLFETAINAKFIAFAAHHLKGDQAGAARARKDLSDFYALRPKTFTNHWSYVGTRHYLEHAGLSADKLSPLLAELRRIQPS